LVAVIGTGVSVGLTNRAIPALSWKELVRDGFAYGVQKGKITAAQEGTWKGQLDSDDLDDLLGAAEFMGRKLEAPHGDLYARWLENVFQARRLWNLGSIRALRDAGIPICTLNWRHFAREGHGVAIDRPDRNHESGGVDASGGAGGSSFARDDRPPRILGVRLRDNASQRSARPVSRSLGVFRQLLFIGCGDTFGRSHFSALILWLRKHEGGCSGALCLATAGEVAARNADRSYGFVDARVWQSYGDLPDFLLKHQAPRPRVQRARPPPRGARRSSRLPRVPAKDCGQMAIEGVRRYGYRARHSTQRLFVPSRFCQRRRRSSCRSAAGTKVDEWQRTKSRFLSARFSSSTGLALLALQAGARACCLSGWR
jgi:hypothetical protein